MRKIQSIILFFITSIIWQCASLKPTAQAVELASVRYDSLIKKVDSDSIALMFTPDGSISKDVHGRTAIKKMLDGFKNFKVLEQKTTSASIKVTGNSAIQQGVYKQVAVSGKDTFRVEKIFTTTWEWVNKEWLIKKFEVD